MANHQYPYVVQNYTFHWTQVNSWKTLAAAKKEAKGLHNSSGDSTRVMHYYTGKVFVTYDKRPNPGKRDIQIRLINGSKSQLKSILRKAGFAVGGSRKRKSKRKK